MSRTEDVLDSIDHALSFWNGHEEDVVPDGEDEGDWADAMRWSPDVAPSATGGYHVDLVKHRPGELHIGDGRDHGPLPSGIGDGSVHYDEGHGYATGGLVE